MKYIKSREEAETGKNSENAHTYKIAPRPELQVALRSRKPRSRRHSAPFLLLEVQPSCIADPVPAIG